MVFPLYRGLCRIARPAVGRWLERRAALGKEDPARSHERLGRPSRARPAGPLVWIHAASVGESLAILPLLTRLLDRTPELSVMVSTGTVTSARLLADRLPPRAFHQYVPVDLPDAVDGFLDHWRPDLALWVESELWPNLLEGVARRAIPAALVNARMSERSFSRWRLVPRTAGRLLAGFRLALAQTALEAERLEALGHPDVRAVGNLKYSASPLPADPEELARLRHLIGDRPRWLMASTHPGEEMVAAAVHRSLSSRFPRLLTLIVPRHPDRGGAIAAELASSGLGVTRRAAGEQPSGEIHVADTLGELGIFFRAAPVAVIGGSFVDKGGHNPLEPALLGSAIIYGPSMFNFAEIARELELAGGSERVAGPTELSGAVARLLSDPERRRLRAEAARRVAEGNRDALDRVLAALEPLLRTAGLSPGPDRLTEPVR